MSNARSYAGAVGNIEGAGKRADVTSQNSQRPIDLLRSRLSGIRGAATDHKWRADCPTGAHTRPAGKFSFGEFADLSAWVKCHAGCTTDEILSAIGLATRDLFPRQQRDPAASRRAAHVDYRMLLELASDELIRAACLIADGENDRSAPGDSDKLYLAFQRIVGVLAHAKAR